MSLDTALAATMAQSQQHGQDGKRSRLQLLRSSFHTSLTSRRSQQGRRSSRAGAAPVFPATPPDAAFATPAGIHSWQELQEPNTATLPASGRAAQLRPLPLPERVAARLAAAPAADPTVSADVTSSALRAMQGLQSDPLPAIRNSPSPRPRYLLTPDDEQQPAAHAGGFIGPPAASRRPISNTEARSAYGGQSPGEIPSPSSSEARPRSGRGGIFAQASLADWGRAVKTPRGTGAIADTRSGPAASPGPAMVVHSPVWSFIGAALPTDRSMPVDDNCTATPKVIRGRYADLERQGGEGEGVATDAQLPKEAGGLDRSISMICREITSSLPDSGLMATVQAEAQDTVPSQASASNGSGKIQADSKAAKEGQPFAALAALPESQQQAKGSAWQGMRARPLGHDTKTTAAAANSNNASVQPATTDSAADGKAKLAPSQVIDIRASAVSILSASVQPTDACPPMSKPELKADEAGSGKAQVAAQAWDAKGKQKLAAAPCEKHLPAGVSSAETLQSKADRPEVKQAASNELVEGTAGQVSEDAPTQSVQEHKKAPPDMWRESVLAAARQGQASNSRSGAFGHSAAGAPNQDAAIDWKPKPATKTSIPSEASAVAEPTSAGTGTVAATAASSVSANKDCSQQGKLADKDAQQGIACKNSHEKAAALEAAEIAGRSSLPQKCAAAVKHMQTTCEALGCMTPGAVSMNGEADDDGSDPSRGSSDDEHAAAAEDSDWVSGTASESDEEVVEEPNQAVPGQQGSGQSMPNPAAAVKASPGRAASAPVCGTAAVNAESPVGGVEDSCGSDSEEDGEEGGLGVENEDADVSKGLLRTVSLELDVEDILSMTAAELDTRKLDGVEDDGGAARHTAIVQEKLTVKVEVSVSILRRMRRHV